MQMEKVGKVVLSLGMILSLLAAYNVKNNIKAEESDTNTIEENKNGPQQNRYYTIIDENGQVIVEEYESEDDEPKTLESNDYKVVKTRGNETYDVKTYDTYEEAKKNVDKLQMYRSPGDMILKQLLIQKIFNMVSQELLVTSSIKNMMELVKDVVVTLMEHQQMMQLIFLQAVMEKQ